jgi:hypothetical protein
MLLRITREVRIVNKVKPEFTLTLTLSPGRGNKSSDSLLPGEKGWG